MLPAEGVISTGYEPHEFQRIIHNNAKRWTVIVAHRRFGKTVAAVNTLIDAALRADRDAPRFGYVAPFLSQAKNIAWDYLKNFSSPIPGLIVREGDLSVEFPNGARIRLFGSDNDQAMRGLYFDGLVLDEIADFKAATWPEVLRPALADREGFALFIGTPKGLNTFHDLYLRAQREDDWYCGVFRADETGVLPDKELAESRASMSDAQYRQEFLCDFSAASENVLITIDEVTAAAARSLKEAECADMPRIVGVDVARFGDDRSVIQRRLGQVALEPLVYQGMNNMDLAARVIDQIHSWKPEAVFIDAGRGEGVIDRCRQLGFDVIEVNFGAQATNPRYRNMRAQMWETMATWIRSGGCLPPHSELKTDLCIPTYSFDAHQKLVLEPKDQIKKRGARSPDLADALALTFAHPVPPKAPKSFYAPERQRCRTEYDVLA